ncbi:MAG: hypothetical protein K2L99_01235 [Muribaculaceae bacterium]|nr:hypothetical protein [Muribaculaceae bacterium]
MNMPRIPRPSRRHISVAFDNLLHGSFLTSRIFKRYFFGVLLIVGLILINISVRYDCVTGMETIAALRTRLQVVRTELQQERSTYMSSTRESTMQQRVDSLGLGLGIQQRPPFKLPEGK